MSLEYTNGSVTVKKNNLYIPKEIAIVLTPSECLEILKTANDTIINNPLSAKEIVALLEIAGELACKGVAPVRLLQRELISRQEFYNNEEERKL